MIFVKFFYFFYILCKKKEFELKSKRNTKWEKYNFEKIRRNLIGK